MAVKAPFKANRVAVKNFYNHDLANNPEYKKDLKTKVENVISKNGGVVSFLANVPGLDRVVNKVLKFAGMEFLVNKKQNAYKSAVKFLDNVESNLNKELTSAFNKYDSTINNFFKNSEVFFADANNDGFANIEELWFFDSDQLVDTWYHDKFTNAITPGVQHIHAVVAELNEVAALKTELTKLYTTKKSANPTTLTV